MHFPATTATEHRFPNGFQVILDEDHAAPVVSAQIWVETGSQDEGPRTGCGISHLLEHMVFKGTKSYSVAELASTVNEAGGQWNAYTSFDRTVYYIDGPTAATPTFLKVLFELAFHPSLPKEDFETERDVIRREIDMGNDDPDNVASQLLFSTFFQKDPRRHPVIGHLALFDTLTYEDMVTYHRERYLPQNSFLVLSGAFDSTEVLAQISKFVEEQPARPLPEPVALTEPSPLGKRVARDQFQTPHSKLSLSWPIPSLEHPDSPAIELLATVAGGGNSSRLHTQLHEEEELAYHIGSWAWNPARGPGVFSVSAEADREDRDQLEVAILRELETLFEHLDESDLKKAKRQTLAQQFKTLSTASGRASDLASNWHEARNLNYTGLYLQQLETVTLEDLRRVRDTYLVDSRLTLVSLDPKEEAAAKEVKSPARTPGEITTHTLSNGLTLILRPDPRVPTISFQAAFRSGLPSETAATNGINALHSALLTQGTEKRTSAEFAREVESLGASLRASSGNNTSIISAFCLQPDLAEILSLASEMLLHPGFREGDLERMRQVQLAALEEALEDPVKTAFRSMRQTLFGPNHYGLSRLGTEDSIKALTADALRAHHQKIFQAHNGVLSLFGDLDPAATIDLCEKAFGSLPSGAPQETPDCAATGSGTLHTTLDRQQAILAIGFPGAPVDSPDAPALEVIHDYCSNMAGPLFTRIREELGLAYFVSATQFHGIGTGLFAFYLGTSPDQLELARTELLAEIVKIAKNGLSEEALAQTKTSVTAADAMQNQSNHAMAQTCAINTLFGLGVRHHEENLAKIQALTTAEVQATAARYFSEQEPVIATVAPAS